MNKQMLMTVAIALAVVWASNNVEFIEGLVEKKTATA